MLKGPPLPAHSVSVTTERALPCPITAAQMRALPSEHVTCGNTCIRLSLAADLCIISLPPCKASL